MYYINTAWNIYLNTIFSKQQPKEGKPRSFASWYATSNNFEGERAERKSFYGSHVWSAIRLALSSMINICLLNMSQQYTINGIFSAWWFLLFAKTIALLAKWNIASFKRHFWFSVNETTNNRLCKQWRIWSIEQQIYFRSSIRELIILNTTWLVRLILKWLNLQ